MSSHVLGPYFLKNDVGPHTHVNNTDVGSNQFHFASREFYRIVLLLCSEFFCAVLPDI